MPVARTGRHAVAEGELPDGRRARRPRVERRCRSRTASATTGLPRVGGRTPNEGARARGARCRSGTRATPGCRAGSAPDPDERRRLEGVHRTRRRTSRCRTRGATHGPPGGYPLVVLLHGCCQGSKSDWRGTIDARGREVALQRRLVRRARLCRAELHLARVRERARPRLDRRVAVRPPRVRGERPAVPGRAARRGSVLRRQPAARRRLGRVLRGGRCVARAHGPHRGEARASGSTCTSPRSRPSTAGPTSRTRSSRTAATSQDQIAPADPALAVSRDPLGAPKRQPAAGPPDARGLRSRDRGRLCVPDVADAISRRTRPVARSRGSSIPSSATAPPTSSCASWAGSPLTRPHGSRYSAWAASPTSCFRWRNTAGWRTRSARSSPDYPVKEYYGDLGDFVQNKGKEWADLCDRDDHPCAVDDYKRGFNNTPRQFKRFGVATRLNRFLDHYARPPGNTRQPRPENDVTVSLQTCPQNATDVWPLDQPGERFNALTFGDLAPNRWSLELADAQPTTRGRRAEPPRDGGRPRGEPRWVPGAHHSRRGRRGGLRLGRARGRRHDDRPDAADGDRRRRRRRGPAERAPLRRLPGRHAGAGRPRRPHARR